MRRGCNLPLSEAVATFFLSYAVIWSAHVASGERHFIETGSCVIVLPFHISFVAGLLCGCQPNCKGDAGPVFQSLTALRYGHLGRSFRIPCVCVRNCLNEL